MTTIAATSEPALLTAADLLILDAQGVRGELIRGEFCETMPPGQRHGVVVANLAFELLRFVKPGRSGTVVGGDSGVWLERDPDTIRAPDIAFTSVQRLPLGADVDGYAEAVPDLVVEVVSPSDRRRAVHDKARIWLSHGVRLVWVVDPKRRSVDVHRPERPVETVIGEGALDGFDILPGFACPLTEIFGPEPQPPAD